MYVTVHLVFRINLNWIIIDSDNSYTDPNDLVDEPREQLTVRTGKSVHPSRIEGRPPFVYARGGVTGESNAGKLFPPRGAVTGSQCVRA